MKVETEINGIASLMDAMLDAQYILDAETIFIARNNAWVLYSEHGWESLEFAINSVCPPWVTHWRPDELVRLFSERTEMEKLEACWRH